MAAPADDTRAAATELLGLLDEEQRRAATYPFVGEERFRWQYTPGPRGGLWLAGMDDAQQDAAIRLMRSGLSASGFETARSIIGLEPVLRELERRVGRPGYQRRDPGHYWFSVFGDPAGAGPWAWRVGGHHLCLHLTVVGGEVRSVPLFFGANPARVPDGAEAGRRVLGAEEDLGRAFVLGLDEDRAAQAIVSAEPPSDIVTGNAVRAELAAVPAGIGFGDLTAFQRTSLRQLVGLYAGRPARPVPVELSGATFAWLGSTVPGEGHYYAVRAGSLLIEYDNTQNAANHAHTVVRDVTRDWGLDLLAGHYADAHPAT
jgi:hypothetical protein